MRLDRPAGMALIGGTLAGMVTMAFHPTGHALLQDFDRVSLVNRVVHSLAIAGTIATVFGLTGLRRHLEARRSLADAALVSYAFGAVAVMFAAIASGFIGTELAARVLAAGDPGRESYAAVREFAWVFNQACTKVFVVAGSIGIALFSLAMMPDPRFGSALGAAGVLAGLGAVVATLAGLPMNIHGFGAIVLGHGIWMLWTGARLVRQG